MDFIDEQHVAAGQVGQQAGQIARALDGRSAGHADVLSHFAGDNARERRFTQTRRAVEQNVIERIPPLPGGLNVDVQAVLHRLLSHVFTQGFGAETAFLIIFFLAEAAHHESFFFHVFTSIVVYTPKSAFQTRGAHGVSAECRQVGFQTKRFSLAL